MTTKYHFINTETEMLVANDTILNLEINGSQWGRRNTRAIPFLNEGEFQILIIGGKDHSEEKGIELFEKLKGIKIEEILPTKNTG